jgi:hypothetical protein
LLVALRLAVEGDSGTGDVLRGESMLNLPTLLLMLLLMLGSREGTGAVARVTILMPLLVLVLAGMNSVVWWFAAGTAIRWG